MPFFFIGNASKFKFGRISSGKLEWVAEQQCMSMPNPHQWL
jgi:hypothetical protein